VRTPPIMAIMAHWLLGGISWSLNVCLKTGYLRIHWLIIASQGVPVFSLSNSQVCKQIHVSTKESVSVLKNKLDPQVWSWFALAKQLRLTG
jgi:hypothetical protein